MLKIITVIFFPKIPTAPRTSENFSVGSSPECARLMSIGSPHITWDINITGEMWVYYGYTSAQPFEVCGRDDSYLSYFVMIGVLVLRVRGYNYSGYDKHGWLVEQPGSIKFENDSVWFLDRHLVNMSRLFCKDATLKLRMAKVVQKFYEDTKGFQLGMIAAGLIDKFRFQISIYRYNSNHKTFRDAGHSIRYLFDGYHNMQGTYNEIITDVILFHQILDYHVEKEKRDLAEARILARKYKVSVKALLELQRKGIKASDIGLYRRSMQTDTKLPVKVGKLPEDYKPRDLLLEDPMAKNINVWSPKKNNNSQEEEYKKKLRYMMWAESWKGYDGKTEGVHIADTIARLGSANDSDFLMKELKGVV